MGTVKGALKGVLISYSNFYMRQCVEIRGVIPSCNLLRIDIYMDHELLLVGLSFRDHERA
jgi:hypothetical protein